MIDIRINNESLDLPPNIVLQLERLNPFLQFNNEISGSYSFPFTVLNTDTNARLLQYAGVYQKKIDTVPIDVTVYDSGIPLYKGKLKVERPVHDMNFSSRSTISCYILTDAADFWQDIKDARMREIDMGGDRSFAWEGLSTITDGFWKHIHQVANGAVNDYDYAFYPVINMGWLSGDEYPPLMNKVYYDVGETFKIRFPTEGAILTTREANRIVPFPYLHYVLEKCFEHIGWTLEGDILSDPDFIKITMLNFRAIDWCGPGTGPDSYHPKDPVLFNLTDHLPDITISAFLIALKNRFGWWFDFDTHAKKCTIILLNTLPALTPVDMTGYTAPLIEKGVYEKQKRYSLVTNDGVGGGMIDLTLIKYSGAITTLALLPSASESIYGWVYLVSQTNDYWICERTDSDAYEWQVYSPNTYNYTPDNATDEIETTAGTVGMEAFDEYLTLIPRMDNEGQWFGREDNAEAEWGIHLLFYHGPVNKSIISTEQFPYASNHTYDPSMNVVGNWALTYVFYKLGVDVGLHEIFWRSFLAMVNTTEEHAFTLHLPMHVMKGLRFENTLLIAGVRLFIYSMQPSLPYKDSVEVKAWRL